MDETPFYRKPWFYVIGWLAFLLLVYGAQIYRMGGFQANIYDVFFDLFCIFPLLLLIWMAFFSQFILPVSTFRDRQKIFDRLISYLFGRHGPAIFIRNGELIKREGEERKRGPGVVWLDSASGAVTRTAASIKQTLGPGVHFINDKEFVARWVDLHIQSQSVGPMDKDKPFNEKSESQTQMEYNEIQERRRQVSALTRDGIEIVPNISISFRVNTGFPKDGKPGSRFGYRKGITKKEKEEEKLDQKAIRNAILSEAVNPMVEPDSPRRRVAWNQLPILLAVDVWREYVAKFTLDELILPTQVVSLPPQMIEPTEEEIDPLSQPIQVGPNQRKVQNSLVSLLREINKLMDRAIKSLEKDNVVKSFPVTYPVLTQADESKRISNKTALQVINNMVTARLTQAIVDILDDHGVRKNGTMYSPEFSLLQGRGLAVVTVDINNIRFSDAIEKQIVSNWEASWLKNAKDEQERINRQIRFAEIIGQEGARLRYANALARHIMKLRPHTKKEALQSLLMRTRLFIIRDDQLQRRMNTEREDIEHILQWMENGP